MVALITQLGQMLLMFFGSDFKRLAKVFNLHQEVSMAIPTVRKPLQCFDA